jgi:peptidoglycan/xylan/chitin deacetylase (PgdA/CDA1 family)
MQSSGEKDCWIPCFDSFLPNNLESDKSLKKNNKLILLMHERAFRRHKPKTKDRYLNYLRKLIDLSRQEGYKFDIVANF